MRAVPADGVWKRLDASTRMFYPKALENMVAIGVSIDQVVLLALVVAAALLRVARLDLSFHRNPMHSAMALLAGLFCVSYLRLVYTEGGFRLPLEFNGMMFYAAYLAALLLFTAEETPLLFGMILLSGVWKGVEATLAYLLLPATTETWGAMTLWRDGYVLGMFFVGWLAIFACRRELPPIVFRAMSSTLFVVAVGFVVSYRRSFMFTIPIAGIPMMFALRGRERKRLAAAAAMLIVVVAVAVFWTDLSRFVERVSVIGNPMEEHSSAYRLFEFQNVLLTIADAPWFGYPMGTAWKVHWFFPFPILSPLTSHNTYLNFLLRGGVFGLGIFLTLVVVTYRTIYRCVRTALTAGERVIAVSLLGFATMFFVASNTAPLLTEPRGATLVGIMLALIAREYDRRRDRLPAAVGP